MTLRPRDIFKQPLTVAELRELTTRVPARELFSWKSPTARHRGLSPDALSDDDLIRLMAEEPRLVRRPLTLTGDRLIVGADLPALATIG